MVTVVLSRVVGSGCTAAPNVPIANCVPNAETIEFGERGAGEPTKLAAETLETGTLLFTMAAALALNCDPANRKRYAAITNRVMTTPIRVYLKTLRLLLWIIER